MMRNSFDEEQWLERLSGGEMANCASAGSLLVLLVPQDPSA